MPRLSFLRSPAYRLLLLVCGLYGIAKQLWFPDISGRSEVETALALLLVGITLWEFWRFGWSDTPDGGSRPDKRL